jgi:peptide/nickel transport system substrate-binding protein
MSQKLRRVALLGAIGGAACVAAAGCGGSSSSSSASSTTTGSNASHVGGTLNLMAESSPDSIDPAFAYQVESWDYMHMMYDGLVAFKEVGGVHSTDLVPDLATALPVITDGGKTYTFTLRKGIKFSDGTPVVASDFKTSLERLWKATSPAPYYRDIVGGTQCDAKPTTCNLTGITTNDSTGQIVIKLTGADGELTDQLALPFAAVTPPGLPDKDVGTKPIPTTGPYMIQSFAPSTGIVLVRNPKFKEWSKDAQPAGYPDTINWKWGVTNEAEVNAVQNGQTDWFYDNPPPDRLNELATKSPHQLHVEPSLGTYWTFLNTRIPPFNNLKARQAVNFAVDRNAVVKLWGGPGIASPTCQIVPASMPGGSPPYCPYTSGSTTSGHYTGPDLAKAKQLIQESGTTGDAVKLLTETVSPVNQIGQYIQTVLTSLGYKVTLHQLAHGPYFTTSADSSQNVNAGWGDWFPDYPVASNFINVLESCPSVRLNTTANNNASLYCNKTIQKQIDAALATEAKSGASSASTQWNAIDKAVTNDAPHVDMFNSKNVYYVSTRLGNWQNSVQWTTLLDQLWVK